jgi:hypothetical protein
MILSLMSCLGMPHLTEMPCMGMVMKLYHSLKMVGKPLDQGITRIRVLPSKVAVKGGTHLLVIPSSKDLTKCKALLEMQNMKEPYVLYR